MEKDIFKSEENMEEFLEETEKEFDAHYKEENETKPNVEEKKVSKLYVNFQKVVAAFQVGIILVGGATGFYAICKAKKNGEEVLPKNMYEEKDKFKIEDNELVIPTVHGNTARIKIR